VNQKKFILYAAVIGAVVGAWMAGGDLHSIFAKIPALGPDRSLLDHRSLLGICLAIFVVYSIYWEVAAKNAAAAKSSESPSSRAVHVVLVNVAFLLEIAPIHGLGRFVPVSVPLMLAGISVESLGLLIAIWARRHLGRNWSGEITVKVDHELIRSGPYRRLRHPIYTGILAMYVGIAMVTGEWLAVVGLVLVMFAYWRKIRMEEATLHGAFGAVYEEYSRGTWALIPGIF